MGHMDEIVYINHSLVGVRQYGFSETLLPPQKDCTTYSPKIIQRIDPPLVAIVTPGNPGIVETYHDFIEQFREASAKYNNNRLPVIIISHNGHNHPGDLNGVHTINDAKYKASGHQDPYQVELQIRNKIVLIKKMLNLSKTKIIMIAHSVGCYIAMKMLQDDDEIRAATVDIILIHPALENIVQSPNGTYWSQVFSYRADWLISMGALILNSVLPMSLKRYFASRLYGPQFNRLSSIVQDGLLQLGNFKSVQAVLSMAKSEFAEIKDLQIDELRKLSDRLLLIYAKHDMWINEDHKQRVINCEDLKTIEKDTLHAFVMSPSNTKEYANLVADHINRPREMQ